MVFLPWLPKCFAADFRAAHQDLSLTFEESRQQLHNRGFSGAVRADKPHGFSLPDMEREISEDGTVFFVGKVYVLKIDHFRYVTL